MYRINLGISRLQPPNWLAPPRGQAYLYAARAGERQLLSIRRGTAPCAIFARSTP